MCGFYWSTLYKNGHNFAIVLPIDVVFASRVRFSWSADLIVPLSMTLTDPEPHFQGHTSQYTRGVQKVLQLDYKEEWKCYKLHFIFQYNPYRVQCICNIFQADC